MDESREAAIIRRCQAGDQEAFGMLVEQYRSVLFGTAYLMIRDRELAEDTVQEALTQMWRHLPSLRLHSSFKAWLVRIVVNEAKQQFRKKRVPTVPLEQAAGSGEDPEPVETSLGRSEDRRHIRQALEMLPPAQKEAVVLRYFSDLSVPEIAAVTGEPEGTIKSRLSRALGHLGDILRRDRTGEEWR